jgi:CelD/BcsL family acetyltransferase involved in cellulose biosynthesis
MGTLLLASAPGPEILSFSANLWGQLAADWLGLLERLPEASVFLCGTWISAWLHEFGPMLQPEALVWRNEEGECVAACIVTIRRERRGPVPVRRAYINATGEGQVGSEHNQILCLPEYRDLVHADLVRHFRRRGADSFVLPGARSESLDETRRVWPSRGSVDVLASSDFYVDLGHVRESGKPYLGTVSRNTRDQIRRSIRLYEAEHGPAAVRMAATAEEAEQAFAELRRLHTERWRALGQPGAFATREANRFHERLIAQNVAPVTNQREFSVDLITISFGSHVVGVLYNLMYRGRVSFYQSGLRYSGDNRLKPGLAAHALAIQLYVDAGASEYDFLAGEAEPARYKESLSNSQRQLFWCEFGVPNTRMWLVNQLRALRSGLRQATL